MVDYLIRLDDACPFMDSRKWKFIEEILDKYDIKPLVGIIPNAKDKLVLREDEDLSFWKKANIWQNKGWAIALHGYDHIYQTKEGGLNPLWKRSEYAGLSYEEQRKKIREGIEILHSHGIEPNYFFAPSHTFDENTLKALWRETDIRIVSDTYSLKPYKKYGFAFIPCQMGHPEIMKIPGLFTICLHPNIMDEAQMMKLEQFLEANQRKVLKFSDIDTEHLGSMRWVDRAVQWAYFTIRRLKQWIR